ncbi:hypothetical protein DSL72_006124 [Monilinia vaccinii-corymbosi]|uniref:ER membrane protein complex subunit 7 beta-sandwich domain-containing protein n=1 Tax=Monilinia vaccinii-corymbosi TaxID=61207 RepID=A0A8A3PHI7_9HELO|nr:hypothetical protein DSL72_006124 [Monilinia vaccinii-corymbosi]
MSIGLLLPIRMAQAIFAIVILGLSGYINHWFNKDTLTASPSEINFLVFVPVFTLLSILYLELAPRFMSRASHPYAHLAFELLNVLFYFAGFISLSVFISKLLFCRGSVCGAARADAVFGAFNWLLWMGSSTIVALEMFKGGRSEPYPSPDMAMKETTNPVQTCSSGNEWTFFTPPSLTLLAHPYKITKEAVNIVCLTFALAKKSCDQDFQKEAPMYRNSRDCLDLEISPGPLTFQLSAHTLALKDFRMEFMLQSKNKVTTFALWVEKLDRTFFYPTQDTIQPYIITKSQLQVAATSTTTPSKHVRMRFPTISALSLLSLLPSALATHLILTIPATPQLNPSTLPPSTHATLSTLSHTHTAPLSPSNSFSFRNLTSGSYLLAISSPTHAFIPLRIDIHTASSEPNSIPIEAFTTFRANEWSNKGEIIPVSKLGDDKYTAEVKVLAEKNYYLERVGFSPLSLLKNPMILIAGFSMVIVFGMPYLMDNMDPELKAEFEERQKSGGGLGGGANPANPLQNFDAAAWLAGSGKKSEGGAASGGREAIR